MISQVNMLVVLFNNLLDRRMIKLGKFKQAKGLFDPTQAIQFIIDIYKKQAQLQHTTMNFLIVQLPMQQVKSNCTLPK